MGEKQIGVTFKGKDREIVLKVAKELGLPVAQVVREATMEGIDHIVERLKKRKEFLEDES